MAALSSDWSAPYASSRTQNRIFWVESSSSEETPNTPIICVTEKWVSEEFNGDRLQDFELRGYNMFSYCRAKRQGGGVFIYVNSSYSVSRVDDRSKAGSVESVWLDITTGAGNGGKLRIAGFYRAGNLSGNLQAELDQEICEELCRNFRTHCLIVGDFNLRGYENGI